MHTNRDRTILGLALLIVGASIVFKIDEESVLLVSGVRLPELCLIKATTGLSCPSCGMTRSFLATAEGDLRAAVIYNSTGIPLFLLVLLQIPFRTVRLLWRRFADRTERWDGKIHLAVLLCLVFYLLAAWAWNVAVFGLG